MEMERAAGRAGELVDDLARRERRPGAEIEGAAVEVLSRMENGPHQRIGDVVGGDEGEGGAAAPPADAVIVPGPEAEPAVLDRPARSQHHPWADDDERQAALAVEGEERLLGGDLPLAVEV